MAAVDGKLGIDLCLASTTNWAREIDLNSDQTSTYKHFTCVLLAVVLNLLASKFDHPFR